MIEAELDKGKDLLRQFLFRKVLFMSEMQSRQEAHMVAFVR